MREEKTLLDNKIIEYTTGKFGKFSNGDDIDAFMAETLLMTWKYARYTINQPVPEHDKIITPGAVVQHFKRCYCKEDNPDTKFNYYYVVLGTAVDTDTSEEHVIYRALYGYHQVYVRRKEEFLSLVDTEKYPDVKQKYRFEFV